MNLWPSIPSRAPLPVRDPCSHAIVDLGIRWNHPVGCTRGWDRVDDPSELSLDSLDSKSAFSRSLSGWISFETSVTSLSPDLPARTSGETSALVPV